ncbi:MAG: sensor histidine kinase [Gammaproteobacteria bacterium]|nr:sensor histidine kinase [Gammaproteobacteria bacterium]
MKLQTQITAVLILIFALLALGLAWQQIRAIRISVAEEIETAGQIGQQVLSRVNEIYQSEGARPMQRFLTRLGRLRAHDITLIDEFGDVIYRTPASDYLPDEAAPEWFVNTVAPEVRERAFSLSNATLLVKTDASRATLEGWLEFRNLLLFIASGFFVLTFFAFWLVRRALTPFNQVVVALRAVETGDYNYRLPDLPGAEANAVGQTFNTMVDSVRDSINAREAAALAKSELARNRELTQEIQRSIEQEHTSLARELHDELGQHVTAIKSLGVSISRRILNSNPTVAEAADMVVESADRIHAAMRQMLRQLRPASLDQFGLVDALSDLVSDWRTKHPDKVFTFTHENIPDPVPPAITTAAFRIAQEAITNALRHSGATTITVSLYLKNGIELRIRDNGIGADQESIEAGFGVTGMVERASAVQGSFTMQVLDSGGTEVVTVLPLTQTEHPLQ